MSYYYILKQDFYLHRHKKIEKGTIVKEYQGHAFGISSHEDIAIQIFIKEEQKSLLFSDNFYVINKNVLEPYQFVEKTNNNRDNKYKNRLCRKLYKCLIRVCNLF